MAKANWHLDVVVDESDPFAAMPVDVRQEGERIDLTDEFLELRLAEQLAREGELDKEGITCSIKDRAESCCSACPLRGSHRVYRIRALCKLGTEQERTLMNMLAADA